MQSPLESALKQTITAGWANKSDGNVEAPTGYFAYISISEAEMPELVAAVELDPEQAEALTPGVYVTVENSDGQMSFRSWSLNSHQTPYAKRAFAQLQAAYAEWLER